MQTKLKRSALYLCLILATGCYKETEVPEGDIFVQIGTGGKTLQADEVSKLNIAVELPMGTVSAKRSVVFSTSKGTFEIENKNTMTVSASDVYLNGERKIIASANLISTVQEGACVISIRVQNYLKQDTVYFTRAYPELITATVDKLNYKPDGTAELTLVAQLKRQSGNGKVSLGQNIKIEAYDISGAPIGNFRNKTLAVDADGKVTNFFSIPVALGYSGQVRIVASAFNSPTSEISETININVLK